MRSLKVTIDNESNWELQYSCKGGGWITVLPISHYGNDLSREDFMVSLFWCLDILLQYHPLTFDGCIDLLMV